MTNLPVCSATKLIKRLSFVRCLSTQRRRIATSSRVLVPLAVGGGATVFGYHYTFKNPESQNEQRKNYSVADVQVNLYRLLPLNVVSRLWGKINDIDLPIWMRSSVLGLYVRVFKCNLGEAANPNLKEYSNLGQFFRRCLKPECRPIDSVHPVVCPSDGVILNCGAVTEDQVEQVKGVTYSLNHFLGPQTFPRGESLSLSASGKSTTLNLVSSFNNSSSEDTRYEEKLKHDKNNNLYHCIIYLAPGDYHRFHSPTDWKISHRRYFPGYLLSVNPRFARRIPQLFNLNERAVYFGNWQHGFFSMALVGATNVGSIHIYCDKDLVTNSSKIKEIIDYDFHRNVILSKGAPLGEFNLGSTIVLVFEASKDFEFSIKPGQKVKFGEPLGG